MPFVIYFWQERGFNNNFKLVKRLSLAEIHVNDINQFLLFFSVMRMNEKDTYFVKSEKMTYVFITYHSTLLKLYDQHSGIN